MVGFSGWFVHVKVQIICMYVSMYMYENTNHKVPIYHFNSLLRNGVRTV